MFPVEPTLAREHFGVPAVLVRIDATSREDGTPAIFEIEDRPSGIGLTCALNPGFAARLGALQASLASALPGGLPVVVRMPVRDWQGGDDAAWTAVLPPERAIGDGRSVLLVRGHVDDAAYGQLAARALCPLRAHQDKRYGVELGWWMPVRPPDLEHDDAWRDDFVLKPDRSWGGRDVVTWAPGWRRRDGRRIGGISTRGQVVQTLQDKGEMFRQEFHPPVELPFLAQTAGEGPWFGAWRLYFGFDPGDRRWAALGGFWNARPRQVKIIGAPDARYGPLTAFTSTRQNN